MLRLQYIILKTHMYNTPVTLNTGEDRKLLRVGTEAL